MDNTGWTHLLPTSYPHSGRPSLLPPAHLEKGAKGGRTAMGASVPQGFQIWGHQAESCSGGRDLQTDDLLNFQTAGQRRH